MEESPPNTCKCKAIDSSRSPNKQAKYSIVDKEKERIQQCLLRLDQKQQQSELYEKVCRFVLNVVESKRL